MHQKLPSNWHNSLDIQSSQLEHGGSQFASSEVDEEEPDDAIKPSGKPIRISHHVAAVLNHCVDYHRASVNLHYDSVTGRSVTHCANERLQFQCPA